MKVSPWFKKWLKILGFWFLIFIIIFSFDFETILWMDKTNFFLAALFLSIVVAIIRALIKAIKIFSKTRFVIYFHF